MAVLRNRFEYDAPPDRVWALVTDLGALAKVCRPYLVFENLPQGRIFTGQAIDVMVRLFGKLPAQPYHMTVESCDDQALVFQSREHGSGVKSWDHRLWLEPRGQGTLLQEHIEIDAGLLTPVFLLWARMLYRARHAPRVDLLKSGAF